MKAPDQHQIPTAPQAQSINYSMLPPEKLPSWLLDKNTPPRIQNFSMRPPDATRQMPEPMQERQAPPPEAWTPPPTPVEPKVIETAPKNEPEKLPEIVASTPVEVQVQDIVPELSVREAEAEASNTPVQPEPAAALETPPVPVEEVPPTIPDRPAIQTAIQIPLPPPMEAPTPAFQPASAPGQSYNAPPPNSKSFGDWILNNSNTAMIIVVGIIIFAIVLIVLLSIGVI